MPREEGFAKQTQVMLLGGWSADDIASRLEAALVEKDASNLYIILVV
jgi:hypothetical protein